MLVRLQIEGRQVAARAGATVMEAAQQAGIYIPSLCSHTALPSHGTCRICMVGIEGVPGYPTACTTPVEEKMVVWVNPPEVLQLRRSILEHVVVSTQHPRTCLECHRRERCSPTMTCQRLLTVRNMEKCLFCPQNQRCELQRAATHIGVNPVPAIPYKYPGLPVLPGGPFFDREYNLCIVCGLCVR
ncbi:MAG: 2Fe-2S iron-sulfur cluster-binding protein, partial [Chloroflexota bacterium]